MAYNSRGPNDNSRNGNFQKLYSEGLQPLTVQFFRTVEGAVGAETFSNAFGTEQIDFPIGNPEARHVSEMMNSEFHANTRENTDGDSDLFAWWGGDGNLDDAGKERRDRVRTAIYVSLGYRRDMAPAYRRALMSAVADIMPKNSLVRLVTTNLHRVECQAIEDDRKVTVAKFILGEIVMVASSKGSVSVHDFDDAGNRIMGVSRPAGNGKAKAAPSEPAGRETRPEPAAV